MRRTVIITLLLALAASAVSAQPRPGSFTTLQATSLRTGSLGTAAAPFLSPTSDTNTGIYWTGSDALGISIDGTLRTSWSTTVMTLASGYQMALPDGLATAPSLQIGGDADSGLYTSSTTLNFGWNMDGTTTKSLISISGAATPTMSFNIADTVRATLAAASLTLATGTALVMPKGTISAPAIAFTADADTGAYLDSSNFLWLGANLNASGPTLVMSGSGVSSQTQVSANGTGRLFITPSRVTVADATLNVASLALASAIASPANGDAFYCTDCLAGSSPCTASSTGAMAFRVNGAWKCF